MSADTLADRILRLSSDRFPSGRLNLAVTMIMMQDGGRSALLGYDGVRKQRYRIDHRLVSDLLETLKDPRLIQTPAFACLSRSAFRSLFFRYWRLRSRDETWRRALGWALGPFLNGNPREGPIYEKQIWALVNDPDEWIANEGIMAAQHLARALTLDRCEVLIGFTHDPTVRSTAAMSCLGWHYKHLAALLPEVRRLLLAPETHATLRSANPSDGRARPSSYTWCLGEMRKALARALRGRVPRVVK